MEPYFSIILLILKFASIFVFCKRQCLEISTFSKSGTFFIKALFERVPSWQPDLFTVLVSKWLVNSEFFAGFVYMHVVLKRGLYVVFLNFKVKLFMINSR